MRAIGSKAKVSPMVKVQRNSSQRRYSRATASEAERLSNLSLLPWDSTAASPLCSVGDGRKPTQCCQRTGNRDSLPSYLIARGLTGSQAEPSLASNPQTHRPGFCISPSLLLQPGLDSSQLGSAGHHPVTCHSCLSAWHSSWPRKPWGIPQFELVSERRSL